MGEAAAAPASGMSAEETAKWIDIPWALPEDEHLVGVDDRVAARRVPGRDLDADPRGWVWRLGRQADSAGAARMGAGKLGRHPK